MAISKLTEAREKYDQAQADYSGGGYRVVGEVLVTAGEELVSARRVHDDESRLDALDLVVKAHLYLNDLFAANLAASDELAMVRRSGNKASESRALLILGDVQSARGDVVGFTGSLKDAVAVLKVSGDKAKLARATCSLASGLLMLGSKEEALPAAKEALELYEGLADEDGIEEAKRLVNRAFVERGMLDHAPNRKEAIAALKDLEAAVDERDPSRWQTAMLDLDKTCAYAQKDVDTIVQAALERAEPSGPDRPDAATFLEGQGVMVKATGTAGTGFKETPKQYQYLHFRSTGLGYGPRFRCGNSYKKQVPGDMSTLSALVCLQVSEEAEDWESDLQFHPGVLDSMLQSGCVFALS